MSNALKKGAKSNVTFLQVRSFGQGPKMRGRLAQRFVEVPQGRDEEEFTKVTTKNGDDRYYDEFKSLSAYLTGMELDMEGDYGEQLQLKFTDADTKDQFKVDVFADSYFGRSFFEKMWNIDITKPVTIQPYAFVDRETGKSKAGLTLIQEGEKLQATWTKDNPGERPPLTKKKKGKKDIWDGTDMMNFYYEQFEKCKEKMLELVKSVSGASEESEKATYEEDDVVEKPSSDEKSTPDIDNTSSEVDEEDLPF